MKYVGWARYDTNPWCDTLSADQDWVCWRALTLYFADYTDRDRLELVVLPEGEHPEGLTIDDPDDDSAAAG